MTRKGLRLPSAALCAYFFKLMVKLTLFQAPATGPHGQRITLAVRPWRRGDTKEVTMKLYRVKNASGTPVYFKGFVFKPGMERIMQLNEDDLQLLRRGSFLHAETLSEDVESEAKSIEPEVTTEATKEPEPKPQEPTETTGEPTTKGVDEAYNALIVKLAGDTGKISNREIKQAEETHPGFKAYLEALSEKEPEKVTFIRGGHVKVSEDFLALLKNEG